MARVESPRGETVCASCRQTGTRSSACICAPAPTPTGPSLAHAARENLLPDFPAHQQELRALLRLRGPLERCSCCSDTCSAHAARSRCPRPAGAGSLALRHVDAGSCNGCEHELTATANPYYDMQRHGLNIVASPRHADVLLVTGQITTRMAAPLRRAYEAMPEPRLVAALGDCAIGCAAARRPRAARRAAGGDPARRPAHPRLPTHPAADRRRAARPDARSRR